MSGAPLLLGVRVAEKEQKIEDGKVLEHFNK